MLTSHGRNDKILEDKSQNARSSRLQRFIKSGLDLQLFKRGKTDNFIFPLVIATLIVEYVSDDNELSQQAFVEAHENEIWRSGEKFKFDWSKIDRTPISNHYFDKGVNLFLSPHVRESFFSNRQFALRYKTTLPDDKFTLNDFCDCRFEQVEQVAVTSFNRWIYKPQVAIQKGCIITCLPLSMLINAYSSERDDRRPALSCHPYTCLLKCFRLVSCPVSLLCLLVATPFTLSVDYIKGNKEQTQFLEKYAEMLSEFTDIPKPAPPRSVMR